MTEPLITFCPFCGSENTKALFSAEYTELAVYRCFDCDLVYGLFNSPKQAVKDVIGIEENDDDRSDHARFNWPGNEDD